jgi:hypothetical protein
MQIQLKQAEIISALKQYITLQGIDLAGKDVTVSFIAGRKESGISAEIDIEENALPDFLDLDDIDTAAPAPKTAVLSVVVTAPAVEPAETQEKVQTDEPVKTTSLFS